MSASSSNSARNEARALLRRYTRLLKAQLPILDDRLKEECGVLAIYSPRQDAARVAFFALFALQHRGQESCGIASTDGSKVYMHKDMGLVSQVFNEQILTELPGHMAVGHTRYSTTGASAKVNAQPIFCQSIVGEIAVAHNGNLINAKEVREAMEAEGEVFDSTSDSEVIARLLVKHLRTSSPEHAVSATMRTIQGAYSCTVVTPTMTIGFRDPNGVRPLVAGRLEDGFMVASETCAFNPVGGVPEHELEPGEMVIIERPANEPESVVILDPDPTNDPTCDPEAPDVDGVARPEIE